MGRRTRKSRKSLMKGGESCAGSGPAYVAAVSSTNGGQVSVEAAGTGMGNALNFSEFKGGKKRKFKYEKMGGSGVLTDLAVPAVLLVANEAMKKRSTNKKRRSFRKRR